MNYLIDKDLLLDLRDRTHDIHERLHINSLLAPLTSDTLCMIDYHHILNAFFGFYSIWEPRFTEFKYNFPHEMDPLVLLEKDFNALQITHSFHKARMIIDPVSFSDYVGYLYVKQGSTLGGQFISTNLEKMLELEKEKTLYYFNGFGAQTGFKWKAFKTFLKDHDTMLDRERVIETATQTFLSMEAYFNDYNELRRKYAA